MASTMEFAVFSTLLTTQAQPIDNLSSTSVALILQTSETFDNISNLLYEPQQYGGSRIATRYHLGRQTNTNAVSSTSFLC